MTYLDSLDLELKRAGIPARRRRRILTEFTDHLNENPAAELGAPLDLARQFADELGTRLARVTAYRAFAVLTVAAITLLVMFFDGGRTMGGWVGYGLHPTSAYMPWWWDPMMIVWFISAQVALASGVLASLRAWRLRHEAVITAADASVLNRRVAVALVAGAITMLLLPITDLIVSSWHWTYLLAWDPSWWGYAAMIGGPVLIVLLLGMLPSVIAATRLRPSREGAAGDLTADIGPQLAERLNATPLRMALALSMTIVLVMVALGIRTDDTIDGALRGLFDAGVCMTAFTTVGRYLGLRATGRTTS